MPHPVQTTCRKLRVGRGACQKARAALGPTPGGLRSLGGLRGESPPETPTVLQQVRGRTGTGAWKTPRTSKLGKGRGEAGGDERGTAQGDSGRASRAPDARGTWPSRGPREGSGARWKQSPSGRRRPTPESPPGRAARAHHGSGGENAAPEQRVAGATPSSRWNGPVNGG